MFAAALGLVAVAVAPKEETTYYEINISVDHVENYEDFVRRLNDNHHSGAEVITRQVIRAQKKREIEGSN